MGLIRKRPTPNLTLQAMVSTRMADVLLGTQNACYGCDLEMEGIHMLSQGRQCVSVVLQFECFFSPLIPPCSHRPLCTQGSQRIGLYPRLEVIGSTSLRRLQPTVRPRVLRSCIRIGPQLYELENESIATGTHIGLLFRIV